MGFPLLVGRHLNIESGPVFIIGMFRENKANSQYHGPLTRYVISRVAHAPGMPGKSPPPPPIQRKPLVSDPGMHHGTLVTRVPWCMSGSLARGDGEKVPGIPGACAPAMLRIWQEAHGCGCHNSTKGPVNWKYTYPSNAKIRHWLVRTYGIPSLYMSPLFEGIHGNLSLI